MQTATAQPTAFHVMTKPRGAICNLDCKYCYFLSKEKLYPNSQFRMSESLLEEYIRQYIEAQQVNEIHFAWQGGEPTLMGLEFFRQAARYQQKRKKRGMTIHNALQTNAVTLDGIAVYAPFCRQNRRVSGRATGIPAAILGDRRRNSSITCQKSRLEVISLTVDNMRKNKGGVSP